MAYKVNISGKGLAGGQTNRYNDFVVDVSECGDDGKISTEIEGPSRVQIKYVDNNDGTVRVSYKPLIPGDYTINVKFNTYLVYGSPYRVKVRGCAPIGLMKYGNGQVRNSLGVSPKPALFSTSSDFLWFKKPWVNFTLNGSEAEVRGNGRKACIESI
ncbi:hypothetical protein B4U79_04152 [Dinothrombium tinctorium]|uniref:Uncharacterized protein n=1 Tax=Dinothrombium tinctorium TaxID=1965070 RepID=A0A443QPA8_9ACAR|nr:hypothetical protein B4U79_04152 [Dinothrombium tinctorium]